MQFLKKKRGSVAPLMLAFEVIVAFSVMMTLISVQKAYSEEGFYRKAFIAKDISMVADASFSYDGNIEVNYPAETKPYLVELNEMEVKVYKENEKEASKVSYQFVKPDNIKIENQILKNPPKISAVKSGNKFSLNKKQSLKLLECPQLDTAESIEKKKIMLDSSHSYTDFGNSRTLLKDGAFVELKESEINKQIVLAVTLPATLYTYDLTQELTREVSMQERLGEVKLQNPNVLVSIHIGSYSSDQNKITAYISKTSKHKEKSRKMGCLMINHIISEEDVSELITSASIAEVEQSDYLLDDDRISVVLEIGNIQGDGGLKMLEKTSTIGEGIKEGILEYYKK